jgi:hypothetical protein
VGFSLRTNNVYLHKAPLLLLLEAAAAKLAQMRSAPVANCRFRSHRAKLVCLCASLLLVALLPNKLGAQAMGNTSNKMSNPTNQPVLPFAPNFVRNHDGYAVAPAGTAQKGFSKEVTPPCESTSLWFSQWSATFTTLYDFSSQKSIVGAGSLNTQFVGIDLTLATDVYPYTSFDFVYLYSHGTGSFPGQTSELVNQHLGEIRILQPLNPFWCSSWRPADQSADVRNQQLAIVMQSAYGGAFGSISSPNMPQHINEQPLSQLALLDCELAVFPLRANCRAKDVRQQYSYPNWVLDLSSGIQFTRLGSDTSGAGFSSTSSGKQLDYVNIVSLTASFGCGWGFLVGVEWDAPLYSVPVHGTRPNHASTATFAGGVVYNVYPSTQNTEHNNCIQKILDPKRWSLSVIYSYTAFDPLIQTNTLEVRISYSLF